MFPQLLLQFESNNDINKRHLKFGLAKFTSQTAVFTNLIEHIMVDTDGKSAYVTTCIHLFCLLRYDFMQHICDGDILAWSLDED